MAAQKVASENKMADYEGSSGFTEGCPHCGRSFNSDSLARHMPICAKTSLKKRKVFDSGKQRAAGTEIPLKATKRPGQTTKPAPQPKNNWRQKHEEFISAIRNARGVQQAMKTGAPLPPPPAPTINPDYVQCQYCQRRFNETAAVRHIAFCKEQHDRIGTKPIISAQAKQRAEARKQFRPPRVKARPTEMENGMTGYGGGYGTSTSYARPPGSGRGGTSSSNPKSASNRVTRTAVGGTSARRDSGGYGGGYGTGSMTKSSSTGQVNSPPVGQPMRTGRDPQTYADAKKSVRTTNMGRGMSRYSNSTESLTRLSPALRGTPPQSGKSNSTLNNNTGRQGSAGSRFCHDCGTQYPISTAKYCCECGVRRLSIGGNNIIPYQ